MHTPTYSLGLYQEPKARVWLHGIDYHSTDNTQKKPDIVLGNCSGIDSDSKIKTFGKALNTVPVLKLQILSSVVHPL